MKKLAVCGCSWSATSTLPEYIGSHWSEILSSSAGLELHNYAVGGVSNFVIRLQIDKVIELKPDLVIITPTYIDRIEIPRTQKSDSAKKITYESIFNPGRPSNNASIITSALWALANKKHNGIHEYLSHIYDPSIKQQIDRWIIRDGISQLKLYNIPFIIQPQILWDNDNESLEFFKNLVDIKNFLPIKNSIFFNNTEKLFNDPGYHTVPNTQKKFADILQTFINNYRIIQ